MGLDWLDEIDGDSLRMNDESPDAFYCPYTNKAECALLIKGWQPQELCHAIECDQMKLFRSAPRRRQAA